MVTTNSYVPVRILETMTLTFLTVYHSLSIGIGDCSLSCHHLLVFCQVLLVTRIASDMLQTIRISATMPLNLLGIMLG
jgi:hypothetical protein